MIKVRDLLSDDDVLHVSELKTGIELSYSYIEVDSEEKLEKLSTGKEVTIDYFDV